MAIRSRTILLPPVSTVEDLRQIVTKQLQELQQYIISYLPCTDLQGSRLSGVGSPQQPNDAVNLSFLQSVLPASNQGVGTSTSITIGTGADSVYNVAVSSGTATPDASKGVNFLILTSSNCVLDTGGNPIMTIAQPINYTPSASAYSVWQLVIQQDPSTPAGGFSSVFDSSYRIGFSVATPTSPAATQCHVDFRTSNAGVSTPTSSLIDEIV